MTAEVVKIIQEYIGYKAFDEAYKIISKFIPFITATDQVKIIKNTISHFQEVSDIQFNQAVNIINSISISDFNYDLQKEVAEDLIQSVKKCAIKNQFNRAELLIIKINTIAFHMPIDDRLHFVKDLIKIIKLFYCSLSTDEILEALFRILPNVNIPNFALELVESIHDHNLDDNELKRIQALLQKISNMYLYDSPDIEAKMQQVIKSLEK